MTSLRALVLLTLLAAVASEAPAALAAQEISGVALDADGRPIPGIPVALHRVGGGGGATVAATTTDDAGGFQFLIEAVDSAVYFVAMRHDERMFIGPPARGGVERVTDYEIRAEPGSEAGAVASALSGGEARPLGMPPAQRPGATPAGAGAGAVWFVAILALVVATIFVTTAPGYRRRRRREMVMELAGIENRLAAPGPDADTAADTRRREALRERLAPRG